MSDPILELLATPPNPSMSVDEHAVHAGGRRRLRRRTLRRTAVGVVGVIGVAAVAFGALGAGVDRDALPANPSPSVNTDGRVSAELLDGRFAVEVLPNAGREEPNVISYSVKDGKRTQLSRSSAVPQVISLGTGTGVEGVMLGTAPIRATQFSVVAEARSGISTETQPLPGTQFQAIAITFKDAKDLGSYRDIIWLDGTGIVRDSKSGPVDSVALPGTSDRAFLAWDLNTIGVFSKDGVVTTPILAGDQEKVAVLQRETLDGATNTWTSTAIISLQTGVLPSMKLTWSPGTTASAPVTIPGPNIGPVFVKVEATRAGAEAPRLTSIRFEDYFGETRTVPVP